MITLLLVVPLCFLSLVTILNALTWPRLLVTKPGDPPFVSVLIPARNEARNLPDTLQAWSACRLDRLEILVLDDHSTDQTAAIVAQYAARDARIRLLQGMPLPTGWAGKNWACAQLAEAARGDCLLFTDADVHWQPAALPAALVFLARSQADLLAIWPTQQTISMAERLVVPLIPLTVMFYLPILAAHHLPHSSMAAAIGQALLFRREAYLRCGGHAAIASNPLDDITLARRIKSAGLRLRLVEANRLIFCRMYTNWAEVRDGTAKSLLGSSGNRLWPILLAVLLQCWLFVFPWLLLIKSTERIPALVSILLGTGMRLLGARIHHQRWQEALIMPVSILALAASALQAARWKIRHGGAVWKGRVV